MTCFIDNLETWLQEYMPRRAGGALLDIGAYHGDFTHSLLGLNLVSAAHLFEPNPKNFHQLAARFAGDPRIKPHPLAIGRQQGKVDFSYSEDMATGSVLPYVNPPAQLSRLAVAQTTLDDWWQDAAQPPIALVKIDTQGADLAVLEGAGKLLASERPALVVELIFSSLYAGQGTPAAMLEWALRQNYRLAGIFNEHCSATGLLAFADAVLIPAERASPDSSGYHARPAATTLSQQVEDLTRVCEERLALINSLHHEAARRLDIINQLQRKPAN